MNKSSTFEELTRSSLQGRTAIVTGGGRGIGAATSKLLASRGANVIVNYLVNKESAERVVAEIKSRRNVGYAVSNGGDALAIQAMSEIRNSYGVW